MHNVSLEILKREKAFVPFIHCSQLFLIWDKHKGATGVRREFHVYIKLFDVFKY